MKIYIYITLFQNTETFEKYYFSAKRKEEEKNPLCFSILGICDSTRALRFNPILRKKSGKLLKIYIFFNLKILKYYFFA